LTSEILSAKKSKQGEAMKNILIASFVCLFSLSAFAGNCLNSLKTLTGVITPIDPRTDFTENVKSYDMITVLPDEVREKMGLERAFKLVQIQTDSNKRFQEREIFKNLSDLIIQIDVTGNTQGHMFIAVRGDDGNSYRYDGRLFFRPQDVKKNDWRLSDGLIIRYAKIPERNRKALVEFLEDLLAKKCEVRAATCVGSAHKVMFEHGHFIHPKGRTPMFPSTFLKELAKTGLVTDEGERLAPEIYTLNRDYRVFWNNLPHVLRIWKFMIPVILNPATWGMRQFEQ
jgi:hypothetical protein